MNRARTLLIMAFIALLCLSPLLQAATPSFASDPGDGMAVEGEGGGPSLASTVNGIQISFGKEFGKTTIWMRVCADAPVFQLRSEEIGQWITEVFYRTQTAGGCSPSTTAWWRMVYNADPNTGEVFRIYAYASETALSEPEFMARAARTDCRVTGYGMGYCEPGSPILWSNARAAIEQLAEGQRIAGTVNIAGWAVDAGSFNGTGITGVNVYVNGTLMGAANYGGARPDVAAALSDSRFTNSGYSYALDTTRLTNGNATIEVRYRSAISNSDATISRVVQITNSVVGVPVAQPPSRPSPSPGASSWKVPYFWQGDPAWGNTRIGACANTIRNVGCALTSLAMIYNAYGAPHNPGTLNSCLGNHACLMQWGSSRVRSCSGGKVVWSESPAFSYQRLDRELKQRPVILQLRNRAGTLSHFIVVISGSGGDSSNYIVHDPGIKNGANNPLSKSLSFWKSRYGLEPFGLRLFNGTPTRASSGDTQQAVSLPAALQLATGEVITGTADIYDVTDTTVILELAAHSSASNTIAMRVWTDQHPSQIWQPFSSYVEVPADGRFFVQFRDALGNTSAIIEARIPIDPSGGGSSQQVHLPLIIR